MNRQLMSEQIQRELAEYGLLTNEAEKVAFWERVRASDAQLTKEDRALVNEVIYDDIKEIAIKTKDLISRVELARAGS